MVSKVTFKINLRDEFGQPSSRIIADAVGQLIQKRIEEYCAQSKSPVDGGEWKKALTKEYKKKKLDATGRGSADLNLTGEMLDALEYRSSRDIVEVGVWGEQAGKAEGNNLGTYGKSEPISKPRQFIPNSEKGETFKKSILKEIEELITSMNEERNKE
jgi:hypothetical protein